MFITEVPKAAWGKFHCPRNFQICTVLRWVFPLANELQEGKNELMTRAATIYHHFLFKENVDRVLNASCDIKTDHYPGGYKTLLRARPFPSCTILHIPRILSSVTSTVGVQHLLCEQAGESGGTCQKYLPILEWTFGKRGLASSS